MIELKSINLENSTPEEFSKYQVRSAVRAVIFDEDNSIGIMNVKVGGFYKLPGGGIEEGEIKEDALKRECLEEAGVNIEIISELGYVSEIKKMHNLIQNSYCYIAKVIGEKGKQSLTKKEEEEGFEIEWMKLDEAIEKIEEGSFHFNHGRYVFERELAILKSVMI